MCCFASARTRRNHLQWRGGGRPLGRTRATGTEPSCVALLTQRTTILLDNYGVADAGVHARGLGRGVAESFLQRQLAHPTFPQPSCVRMAQSVRRQPWRSYLQLLAPPLKELDQCRVAERLT